MGHSETNLDLKHTSVNRPKAQDPEGTAGLPFRATTRDVQFENDIRREWQMDGIKKARERGTRFGRKPLLVTQLIQDVRRLRKAGQTVPEHLWTCWGSRGQMAAQVATSGPLRALLSAKA